MRLELPRRFQRKRWSKARKIIHALKRGQKHTFPDPAVRYCSLATTVTGLNDAYEGTRVWRKVKRLDRVTVYRVI